MNRISWRYGFPRRYGPRRRVRRGLAASPTAEPLEDRTLLSLNWTLVGPGLQGIFSQLQASVTDHLLGPKSVNYSLPLVGTQLGQAADPVGQVFANIAQTVDSTFQSNPPVSGQNPEDTVVSDLNTALASYQPQVTNTLTSSSQATFSVQAATSAPLTETVALELGLPGLAPLAVTANKAVGVQLTFTLDLNFGLDQTGVFVDPTQNSPSSPLLQVELKANLGGWAGTAGSLNGVDDQVTDDARAPSSLDVPVTFNASASGNIYNFGESDIDQINFAGSAAATVDLDYALVVPDAPALTLDLGVQWQLNSVVAGTGPFDGLGDGPVPTVAFDAGVDLSSVGSELDAANSPLIQALVKQIKPLQDVVDFFYQPLPVLSNLGITVTPRTLLQDFLPLNDKGFLTVLDSLHDLISGTGSFSFPSGAEATFASSTLPSTVDPRTAVPFSTLLSSIEAQATPDSTEVNSEIQPYLTQLGTDLGGTVILPMLADPALAFDGLLTNDSVALVQYTLTPIKQTLANIALGPAIGPIIPPIPLFLQLTASFGITAGLTLGYDTYGFHNAAGQPIDGLFIAKATAQLTGSIGLTGELDVGLAQAGAKGSVGLSFGVTNINTATPNTHQVQTVDQNGNAKADSVLQLDDFTNDVVSGGPFCPFIVGGSANLSLTAFVQVGVSPFDINYTYPLGSITLFDFSCPSCQPPTPPTLAELYGNLDPKDPPIPGLPVADIQKQLPGTNQVLVLDMGDFASRRQNVNSTGATDEDFEISLPTDQKGINDKALLVSAFGAVEEIPGADTTGTTIVALEGSGTMPETVEVDSGVAAGAYLIGGPYGNDFQYLGNGNTYMVGGTWGASQGDPAKLKSPIQTLNTLQGGFGQNTLTGGNLSSAGYDAEKQAAWNMLIANPAEILGAGQDGGQDDTLQAGNAGVTMKGGGFGGDDFFGSDDPLAQIDKNSVDPSLPSQVVMIAGNNDKGLSGDDMFASYGQTDFQWQEGAGPLTVTGGAGPNCQLDVLGDQAGETWTLSSGETDNPSIVISGEGPNQQSIGEIHAFSVPTISVDADNQANTGGETYVINDLSMTGVAQVNVNLHEYTTAPDADGDRVIINGASGDDVVFLGIQQVATGQYGSNGEPIYKQQWTTASIATSIHDQPISYDVDAALPKATDSLAVNTFGGNDSVTVTDTQPDATTVSTGGGNDTIQVGGSGSALDDIQGPLLIDAGAGANQITFYDDAGTTGDILTLTSSLVPGHSGGGSTAQGYLLRYKGQIVPGNPDAPGQSYRYPMAITFQATGGDFSGGVALDGTYSFDASHTDQIYVQGVLPNAPTTVQTNGLDDQVYVGFDGGADGATSDPTSTLDYLPSTLTVNEPTGMSTALIIDDEGSPRPETYQVSESKVSRINVPADIDYQNVGQLLLKAATPGVNTIDVLGTESGTPTTVDAGAGNNDITVGDSSQKLDEVLGRLTINGGAGQDPLTIDDSGNGQPQNYVLSATQFERVGPPAIKINYSAITSLGFQASENGFTNDISVTGTPSGVPVTVQTGDGSAALGAIGFDDIQGPLTFQWSQGFDTFVGLDTGAAESATYQVLPDQITRTGAATIQFADPGDPLTSMTLYAGGRNPAEVDVPKTIDATAVTIAPGDADDTVLVSKGQEDLDTIQGQLTIDGTSSTVARLFDQNGPQGRDYVLDAGSLRFKGSLPAIAFKSLGILSLEAGGGSYTTVDGTAAETTVILDMGQGTNYVVVGSVQEELGSIAGPLTVNGQSGQDELTLTDDGTSSKVTYTLNNNSVAWSGASEDGSVQYSHLKAVTLNGSDDTGTYDLQGANPNTQVTVMAEGSNNSVDGITSILGIVDEAWSITGFDSVSLFGTTFYNVQNLVGGVGTDVFAFGPGAVISGKISGSGGSDWLDYSAYNHPVAVDLAKGTATAVTGGVQGIENVRGGAFGNTLIGDTRANVLIGGAGADVIKGGSGPSILIGDQGSDSITVGPGGSILIGGVTNDDASSLANDLALDAILAEWRSAESYTTRIKDIMNGVGPTGSSRLVWKATVHDDGSRNKLTGGAGRDWFFKGARDKLVNKKPGERVN